MKRLTYLVAVLMTVLVASLADAATYYIAPTGANVAAPTGGTSGAPWLTFTYAMTQMSCGDTLLLKNGTYGDGTSTGKISISSKDCSPGAAYLTFRAENSRQAKIVDNGTGRPIFVSLSKYIIFDGIVARSTDNSGVSSAGEVVYVEASDHIQVKNMVLYNPNRYVNNHPLTFAYSNGVGVTNSLIEDVEIYKFHRHGVLFQGINNVVRRLYCNPREGGIGLPIDNGPGVADSCVAFYPASDSIAENIIADGTVAPLWLSEMNAAGATSGNKLLGSILYRGRANGVFIDARFTTDWGTPQNNTVENVVIWDHGYHYAVIGSSARGNTGIRSSSARNTIIKNVTVSGYAGRTQGSGVSLDLIGLGVAPFSGTITNSIFKTFDLAGYYGASSGGQTSWSGNYIISYGNAAAFNPLNDGGGGDFWQSGISTSDPTLGTCVAWIPASATPAKGTGQSGADIGANVLYRYVDGILTTTPLWDPTDGSFPHGAADPDNVNRQAGNSLYDFHTRINVNTGGCSFPSGYAGGGGEPPPAEPTNYSASTGTTSTSHSHTVPANTDAVLVCVAMWDTEFTVGAVSTVTVGGNSATLIKRQAVTSPDAYRAAELWRYIAAENALSGATAISVSTTGAVDGMVTTSIAVANGASVGTGLGATNLSSTPSVTVSTSTGETVYDCLAASKSPTLSADASQTLQSDTSHASLSLRGAVSTQNGVDGGVMSYTMGGNNYWAMVAVSVVPQAGGSPPSPLPTIKQKKGRWRAFYGTEADAGWLAAADTLIEATTTAKLRLRISIIAEDNNYTITGFSCWCSVNAGAYFQVTDTFSGGNKVRLIGPGYDPNIPSSATATTQLIDSGTFVPGIVYRSDTAVFTVTLNQNNITEVEWVLELNAAKGDLIDCRGRLDNGGTFDSYTATPRLRVMSPGMAMGF